MKKTREPTSSFERSRELLTGTTLRADKKAKLVRKLLQYRDDPRVPQILSESLSANSDPRVMSEILLVMGVLGSQSHRHDVLWHVGHADPIVVAAALDAAARMAISLDAHDLLPLVHSKDADVRRPALEALMRQDSVQAMEIVGRFASSDSCDLRRTAVECLAQVETDQAGDLAFALFVRESTTRLLKPLARKINRHLSAARIKELLKLKASLLASEPSAPDERKVKEKKLLAVETILKGAYTGFAIDPTTVGTLEGQVDRVVTQLKQRATNRTEKLQPPPPEPRRPAFRLLRPALLFLAVVASLGAFDRLVWTRSGNAPRAGVGKLPARTEIESVLGKAGDPVSVEGRILGVYAARKGVAIAGPQAVLLYAAFPAGLPGSAKQNARVHVTGRIASVKSRLRLYVDGEKLEPVL